MLKILLVNNQKLFEFICKFIIKISIKTKIKVIFVKNIKMRITIKLKKYIANIGIFILL